MINKDTFTLHTDVRRRSVAVSRSAGLLHCEYLVGLDSRDVLRDPAGPPDFHPLYRRLRSETEMHALVAGGKITTGGCHRRILRASSCDHLYFCPDGVAIALVPGEFQNQPVVRRARVIADHVSRAVAGRYHSINPAVIIDVAHRKPPAGRSLMEDFAGCRRDIHEAFARIP